ncbi:EpsG family protein [Bacteroides uniformis]|uniref:EpsG family protein n=1 Tax=Bacteroides uniformis TaxID=820 RepID=UPI0039B64F86
MLLTINIFVSFLMLVWGVSKYPLIGSGRHLMGASVSLANMLCMVLPILYFSFILGLRYEVGVDYPIYRQIYEYDISADMIESLRHRDVEWLYVIICSLLHKLGSPYYMMFVVMAVIPMTFYFLFIKQYPRFFFIAMYFLLATGVLFWYMNIMRQGIAFFILLYACQYIIKKKIIHYILFVLIATGFHTSALLFLPAYLLYYCRGSILNRLPAITLYLICWFASDKLLDLFFSIIGGNILTNTAYMKYANVIATWEMGGGSGLGVISLHLVDLSLIVCSSLIIRENREMRVDIFYNLFLFGSYLWSIAGRNIVLSRIPFCFVSMRFFVAAITCWYISSYWRTMNFLHRLASVFCILFATANLAGNLINTEYNFVCL